LADSKANGIENGIIDGIMNAILTIDKAGRVVLPKPIRDALQINPGDSLELESQDDQIILRPARGKARMYKKQGMWVLHGETSLPPDVVEDTVRRVRRERERAILGKQK
jgi:AbrB family looped-hinge helix DNA binding protein